MSSEIRVLAAKSSFLDELGRWWGKDTQIPKYALTFQEACLKDEYLKKSIILTFF